MLNSQFPSTTQNTQTQPTFRSRSWFGKGFESKYFMTDIGILFLPFFPLMRSQPKTSTLPWSLPQPLIPQERYYTFSLSHFGPISPRNWCLLIWINGLVVEFPTSYIQLADYLKQLSTLALKVSWQKFLMPTADYLPENADAERAACFCTSTMFSLIGSRKTYHPPVVWGGKDSVYK